MASMREQIVQAVCDALNAPVAKPCAAFRNRIDAFAKEELPTIVVFAIKEDVHVQSSNTVLRKLTLRVEILVEGEPPADNLIDPVYLHVMKTLDNSSYFNFAAVGIRRVDEVSTQFETEASYQNATAAVVDFEITYATTAGDPTQKVMG